MDGNRSAYVGDKRRSLLLGLQHLPVHALKPNMPSEFFESFAVWFATKSFYRFAFKQLMARQNMVNEMS